MGTVSFALFGLAAMFLVQVPPAPGGSTIGDVAVSGSFRSRLETWNWFQADAGDNSYAYSGNLLRVSLSQKRRGWDWNAEFAVPFLLALPKNPFGPGTQGALGFGANYLTANNGNRYAATIFPKQLSLQITSLRGNKSHALKIGRFEFLDGTETAPENLSLAAIKRERVSPRLIGTFGWTHVGRSFDGVHYSFNKPSGNFTFVGAIPTRGVFQVDGWGWNKTAFGYASYTRPWGKGAHAAETRLFAIFYDDWRKVHKTDNRPPAARAADLANIRVATFGGHTVHAYATKRADLDLLLWGAFQTGRWGVQDHRAHAIDVELGVQPKVAAKLKPWLRGGFYLGSGDGQSNDAKHETFFQLLPTPRLFARFPFFNMMNNQEVFGILILRPHAKVTVSSEFHALRLSNQDDLWYIGGGVFQPWSFGYVGRSTSGRRSLANLYDASVEYRVNPQLTWTGYFGYAQGLAAVTGIYPRGKNGQLGYLEVSYRF